MCRHLGYVGPTRSVREVITAGEFSLLRQSWDPRDMRGGGTINADGFGAAWWGSTLSRYRSAMPIWSDPALPEMLSRVRSHAVLAAIRSATVGMPVERSACAPFVSGHWAFSHNGRIVGWPESMVEPARGLPTVDLLGLEAPTDSALLWLLVRDALRENSPEVALIQVTQLVAEAAPESRLNMLLGDGRQLWATTWDHSLSALVDDDRAVLSSEPFDRNHEWKEIPDGHIVTARPGHLINTPL
ncbi:ergothioneine biosynthesis protein EgtC [Prescottella agglutinans]|uniref:Gamma-glutamyl-hercynylcysteine sulfoxide hydrolase n=1 Tax=Prescottella agglutinans TaxID=1644129 RepID=A0A438BI39_9NOCA|nr:ergothioneine biosynthesis protein EgtC [Prescottella agglutinans]RVW10622.1 ergothioneine biosynthesis protein EgtC [Prescottella agglutinans]